jgi:uncharacterized 2Fe-2S/4Fe-4S cluster protein (DUF4445 family)
VRGEVVVNVPEKSRLKTRKIQLVGMEREVKINPAITKFHVATPHPSLSDVRADVERTIESLVEKYGFYDFRIDLEVLKTLPDTVRAADWSFTAAVWNYEEIVSVEAGDTSDELFGFAMDIGTSKIAGHLVDLATGCTIGMGAVENPQLPYGEDVISRISFAMKNDKNLLKLQKLAVEGVNDVIERVCSDARIEPINIYEVTVAGNTIMHHLFLGIQPRYVALSPFTPAVKHPLNLRARELNLAVNPNARVYMLPNIAGYVGGDAVGDVLATDIYEKEDLCLLIDIGTNTEIFLGNRHGIVSCSCASGPAFEGYHIKHGVKAVSGAIEKVEINPTPLEVRFETIGGEKPVGMCGSGIVDCVAELFKHGVIDIRGNFSGSSRERLIVVDGEEEFIVALGHETATGRPISITRSDIDEVLLAKATIHAGSTTLMKRKGLKEGDIDEVYIAGAFGSSINPVNAKTIGLIPDIPTEKVRFVGNTALSGAKLCLISREMRLVAERLSGEIGYIKLTVDPEFPRELAHSLYLPKEG